MTHNYFQKKHTQLCSFFTVLTFLLLNSFSINAQTTDSYTASGNWTVPVGVVSVTVEIWGAGGGGGGSNTNNSGGSGGGSGAYVTKTMAVTAGTNYTFTIGTGGAGGAANTATGTTGGNSTINFPLLLSAGGGTGGTRNSGTVGAGGIATGATNTNGNPGIAGGASGGKGGNSPNGGAGGAGATDGPGVAGATPGAGGGGGEKDGVNNKNKKGGDGAQGEIHFTYVVPGSYCAPTNTSSTSYYISGVTTTGGVANINNTPTGFSAYTNYSAQFVSQYAGSNFSISATHPSSTYGYNVWIDWNNDTDFNDAGENVISTGYLSTPASLGSVAIPLGQTAGDYRMRIRNAYLSNPAPACGEFGYGEAEDYTVRVIIPAVCSGTPIAGTTTTSPASGTPGSSYTVSASGYTNATGLTYQWQYSLNGGAWTNQGLASVTYSNYTATAPAALGDIVRWHLIVSCGAQSATSTNGSFTCVNILNIPTTGNNTVSCGTSIVLYDNGGTAGDYANSSSGYTVLDAGLGATITISGNYTTESVDYIRIYNGTGTGGTLLASYSGTGSINYTGTAGQTLTVQFYSDSSVVYSGFTLSVSYSGVCFPACAGTPTSGTVTTNPNTNWPGNPYTVTATGYTQALNMTYQWQNSPDGVTWSNVGVATSSYANYNAIAPASGIVYWHLVVTCTNSSQTSTSSTGIFTTMAVSTVVTGCPNVVSGGLGLNGADPATITCTTSGCVDLEANYLDLGQTTSYTVEPILYSPPSTFNTGLTLVSVNTDDVWSPLVSLPFDFCFYGNKYSQCVIGSNGILSFNASLAGTSSGYSFNNNIPISGNTVLRENSIFGVLHDIDPGVTGGTKQVGWKLITLPTGCRALVASWSDVPMFSDNAASLEYTGMMVLYENSNIIEVYVKNKRLDNAGAGTWNNGNAIIGIQNATGTIASVPPGRNGLDPNWTAANEAWRFVPSGASLTTIAWHEGALAGPVVGTTPTINVCPSVTTDYFAEITYTLSCGGPVIKVNDKTTVTVAANKVWDGSSSTDWNTAANWTPASIPTATESVVIPNVTNDPIVGSGVAALACSLTVQNGAVLTVNASNNITVTNVVTVAAGGTFNIKNTGNLVQVNNVPNSGNINMVRVANLRLQDYCYWSSPVGNMLTGTFPVQNISPLTPAGYIYKWGPTTVNPNGGQGYWINTTENMIPTKGYILRAPSGFNNTSTSALTTNFIGVPNNGVYNSTILRGNDYSGIGLQGIPRTATDDNWNLIGNPYPSSIGINEFLTLPANSNIVGGIKIWSHGLLPTNMTNPFYQNFLVNYYPSDYITVNLTGATSGAGDYKIGSGQGFMVLMNAGAPGSSTVTFNNSMRSATFTNNQFYKNGNTVEQNRIWLDLVSPTGEVNRTLVGYVDGATNAEDRLYDMFTDNKPNMNFYSLIDGNPMIIQGKTVPFDINDIIPMGVQIPASGTYNIAIADVDGLFTAGAQIVYLEDKSLNVIHNLTASQYQFTAEQGIINDRFVLRYTENALSNNDYNYANDIKVYTNNGINVTSTAESIKDIVIYDVLGKTLLNKENISKHEVILNELKPTTNVLIVKVVLENNNVVMKKVIY
jgi:hypothetical protein